MQYEKNPLTPHLEIYSWQISSLLSITHRIIGVVNFINNFVLSLGSYIIYIRENFNSQKLNEFNVWKVYLYLFKLVF